MNGVILGMLVGVSRKLASANPPKITKYIGQSPPYPPGGKGWGEDPHSLPRNWIAVCVPSLLLLTTSWGRRARILSKKGRHYMCIGS